MDEHFIFIHIAYGDMFYRLNFIIKVLAYEGQWVKMFEDGTADKLFSHLYFLAKFTNGILIDTSAAISIDGMV